MLQTFLFFIQGIPETAGIVACSLALARVKLRWGVILVFACILTAVVYLVRNLPVTFGLHTVVFIFICALLIARTTRVLPSTSFMVSFAGSALLALMEVVMYELICVLFDIEIYQLTSNDYTLMLIGLPQALTMIVIALIVAKYRRPLEGMWMV